MSNYLASGKTFQTLKPEELSTLLLNVDQQIGSLNQLAPALKQPNQKTYINEYTDALVRVRTILREGITPQNTRAFGEASQDLTNARDALLATIS
ncbi:hypothetical protein [Mesorhizobium sp. M0036]|uniref:hypothetical protein n=1 Tax=Mesorhizobium sp. M0036 TaxID=2956853 RepID=UPI003339948C